VVAYSIVFGDTAQPLMNVSEQSIDHARLNFLLSLRESARFSVLPGGTGQRRKSSPTQASLQRQANFSEGGLSKRPEMSSPYEKSEKAKTMKGN